MNKGSVARDVEECKAVAGLESDPEVFSWLPVLRTGYPSGQYSLSAPEGDFKLCRLLSVDTGGSGEQSQVRRRVWSSTGSRGRKARWRNKKRFGGIPATKA